MKLGLATGGGVLLEEVFLDGFIILGLGLSKSFLRRVSLESLQSGFDVFLDLFVVRGALVGLTRGLFGGFNNRHFLPI